MKKFRLCCKGELKPISLLCINDYIYFKLTDFYRNHLDGGFSVNPRAMFCFHTP